MDERTEPADRLVAFVTARLDEREAAAKAATPGSWNARPNGSVSTLTITDANRGYVAMSVGAYSRNWPSREDAAHIALNDPAYVLADIAAKRQIIALAFRHDATIDSEWGCCHAAADIEAGLCPEIQPDDNDILRLLAAPFRAHPDFDPAWAVGQ